MNDWNGGFCVSVCHILPFGLMGVLLRSTSALDRSSQFSSLPSLPGTEHHLLELPLPHLKTTTVGVEEPGQFSRSLGRTLDLLDLAYSGCPLLDPERSELDGSVWHPHDPGSVWSGRSRSLPSQITGGEHLGRSLGLPLLQIMFVKRGAKLQIKHRST